MQGTLLRICRGLQARLWPSKQQKLVAKWYSDGADRLRYEYDIGENSLVLDVGSYDGQWASDIFSRYCCRMILFEPVRVFAEALARRFARNPLIEVNGFGLGGYTRMEMIAILGSGSSVVRRPRSARLEEVSIVDMWEWWRKQGIAEVHLMKINIEGGEYELLDRMIETGLVTRVRDIQVQFHRIDSSSERRMKNIQSLLARTHRLTWQYEWVWESWRRFE
ncbi:FkbM family methyltransferase [Nitrospira calida]